MVLFSYTILFITYSVPVLQLEISQLNGAFTVVHVFKNGEKTITKNYTPILLLCNSSKVLEKLVHNRIVDFITNSIVKNLDLFLTVQDFNSC